MPVAPRRDRHPGQVSGYRRRAVRLSFLSIFLFAACSSDAGVPKDKPVDSPPGKTAGVFPERFDCTTIVSIDTLAQLLGGNARRVEGPMGGQRGVPKPCEYEIASEPSHNSMPR